MMGIDKKVTINIFLNQRLKPKVDENGDKAYPVYFQVTYDRKNTHLPIDWLIYSSVFWDGSPSNWHQFGYVTEEQFHTVKGKFDQYKDENKTYEPHDFLVSYVDGLVGALLTIEKIIFNIVEYEVEKYKSRFTLKKLGKRLKVYLRNVFSDLEESLNDDFYKFIQNSHAKVELKFIFFSPEFYRNFDRLYRMKLLPSIPPDLKRRAELYFLLGAFSDFSKENLDNTYYEWLVSNGEEKFKKFLLTSGILKEHEGEDQKLDVLTKLSFSMHASQLLYRFDLHNDPSFYISLCTSFIQDQIQEHFKKLNG